MKTLAKQVFEIPGRLPGLNEMIHASARHWAVGARLKSEKKRDVCYWAMAARIKPVHGRAKIQITCYEPNRRRDVDNVSAGARKIILDALQDMHVIRGDGQRYIDLLPTEVLLDRENPRIVVSIEKVACSRNYNEEEIRRIAWEIAEVRDLFSKRIWAGTDVDMILQCFDDAVKDWRRIVVSIEEEDE